VKGKCCGVGGDSLERGGERRGQRGSYSWGWEGVRGSVKREGVM